MSCGGGCPGGSGSPSGGRLPSYIPNTPPQRQRAPRDRPQNRDQPGRCPGARPVASSPQRQVGAVAPYMGSPIEAPAFSRGPQLPRFATPVRGGPRPVAAVPCMTPPPPPADQTFRIPGRLPPVPRLAPGQIRPAADETFNVSPERRQLDQTYGLPGRLPPVPRPMRGSPVLDRGFLDQTYGIPARLPPVPRPMRGSPASEESYELPRRFPPPRQVRPGADETFTVSPDRRPLDQTYGIPGRSPPSDATYVVPTRTPAADRTYVRTPPRADQTYRIPRRSPTPDDTYIIPEIGVPGPPRRPRSPGDSYELPRRFPPPRPAHLQESATISYDNAEELADSVMGDLGEGDEWTVSSAVSIDDFGDDTEDIEDDEDITPSFANVGESTGYGDPCVPCEGVPNRGDQSQLYESSDFLHDTSRRTYLTDSQFADDEYSSAGIFPGNVLDQAGESTLNVTQIQSIAEAPSNISVYDAEELNRTTAPRNSDIDIPRTRIWQSLINSLNETENEEDREFEEFIGGLQQERRRFMESTPV